LKYKNKRTNVEETLLSQFFLVIPFIAPKKAKKSGGNGKNLKFWGGVKV
jgi:hypothetical protein